MLEALVSLRRSRGEGEIGEAEKIFADEADKKVGDIIVVKRRPCVWSDNERRFFLITLIKDDELEADMEAHDQTIRSLPYAQYAKDGKGDLLSRSNVRLDITPFAGLPGLDPDDVTAEPTLPAGKSHIDKGELINALVIEPV